jgi:hypothetical protein
MQIKKSANSCFLILTILLIIPFCQLRAQEWPKIFGGNFDSYVNKIIEDYDQGFFIGGSILSNPNIPLYAWVIKIDVNGNELWNKRFGNGVDQFYLSSCCLNANEGPIICGGTSLEDPQFDPLFYKLNVCGEPEWCKILRSPGYNLAKDVISVPDGYIGMLQYYGEGETYARISLVKLNQIGEPIWIQRLAQEDTLINNEEGGFLYLTSDSNYLVSGECFHPGLKPYWIKTDTSGIQMWNLMWQGGIGGAYQVVESSKGFFYSAGGFAGQGYAMTPVIFKFDNDGNSIYQKYLLGDTLVGGGAEPIISLNDSTLGIGIQWRVSPYVSDGYSEILITDTLGIIKNRRILLHENHPPRSIILTKDNKIIVAGNYVVNSYWDIYLWKMNSDLEDDTFYTQPLTYDSLCPYQILSDTVDLDCSLFVNIEDIPTKEVYESTIKISPNPARDWIALTLPDVVSSGNIELGIYNIFGQEVMKSSVSPQNRVVSLNVSRLGCGFYLAVCRDTKKKVFKGKFVVSR